MKIKIISGGQTGVDRAALDAAIAAGLTYGGIIPKGRIAEDGRVPQSYHALQEADVDEYSFRTEQNVLNADATLILGYLPMSGGTMTTNQYCHQHGKSHLFINLEKPEDENRERILEWLQSEKPAILNIAGPRESKQPGIYKKARRLLESVFEKL